MMQLNCIVISLHLPAWLKHVNDDDDDDSKLHWIHVYFRLHILFPSKASANLVIHILIYLGK